MFSSGEFNNKETIKNILSTHNYQFRDCGDYLTCQALFRGGDDIGSVAIYPHQIAIDFVTSQKYSISDFIMLVADKKTKEELDEYFVKNNIVLKISAPQLKIKQQKILDDSILEKLSPIYDYWINRGINENILKELKSGLYQGKKGIWRDRYIFPIFNSKNQIVALNGRLTTNENRPKWVFREPKSVVYPAFINYKDIKEKNTVILVESIGDLLALMTCGIRNVLVTFGTSLNLSILNFLLKTNIDKIFISTNNDELKNNAGNLAAEQINKKLWRYFNKRNIHIKLPAGGKDWNDILVSDGKQEILEQWNKL